MNKTIKQILEEAIFEPEQDDYKDYLLSVLKEHLELNYLENLGGY